MTIKEVDLISDIFVLGYYDFLNLQQGSMCLSGFDSSDYPELDEFTFLVDMEILNEYNLNGDMIDCQIEKEWNKFIIDEKIRQMSSKFDVEMSQKQPINRAEIRRQ